jgi:hypothetical protein
MSKQQPMEETLNKQTSKLPEGWHFTEKYGDVFVSPGGIAWVVERQGNKLESISVPLTKDDMVKKLSEERTKNARYLKEWRKSKRNLSKPSNLTGGEVKGLN